MSGLKYVVVAGHAGPFKNLTLKGKLFKSDAGIETRSNIKAGREL
jgi:hypothetical protein